MNTRTTWLAATLSAMALVLAAGTAQALALHSLKGQQLEIIYGTYAPDGNCQREPRITVNERGFDFEYHGRTMHPPTFDYNPAFYGAHGDMHLKYASKRAFYPFPSGVTEGKWGPTVSGLGLLRMIIDSRTHKLVIEYFRHLPVQPPLTPFQAALIKHSPYARCSSTSTSSNASSAAANGTIRPVEVSNPTPAQTAAVRRALQHAMDEGTGLHDCLRTKAQCYVLATADFNDDGRPDLLAYYMGNCGTVGCGGAIVMATPDGYAHSVIELPLFYFNGVQVLPGKHHGMHDLQFPVGPAWTWNGQKYQISRAAP